MTATRRFTCCSQVSEELFFQNYFHHLHVIAEGGATHTHARPTSRAPDSEHVALPCSLSRRPAPGLTSRASDRHTLWQAAVAPRRMVLTKFRFRRRRPCSWRRRRRQVRARRSTRARRLRNSSSASPRRSRRRVPCNGMERYVTVSASPRRSRRRVLHVARVRYVAFLRRISRYTPHVTLRTLHPHVTFRTLHSARYTRYNNPRHNPRYSPRHTHTRYTPRHFTPST